MAPSQPSKGWVFTVNNPTDVDDPSEWIDGETVQYAKWQLERGESGTLHWQGHVVLKTKQRLSGVKRLLHSTAHWEIRRGTLDQADDYCSKEETRVEGPYDFGDRPASGRGGRSDLLEVKRMLDAGKRELEVAESHFGQWCRYHKAFKLYAGMKMPVRSWVTFTTVYWGDPGVGKTRRIVEEAGSDNTYWLPKPNGTRVFWDGYEGQENVVIDEFFGWMPRDLMCRLCDRYPFRVETKGGSVPFTAKKIWITSNNPPNAWWPRIGLGPMRRRLSGEHGVSFKMLQGGDLQGPDSGLEPVLIPLNNPVRISADTE